MKIRRFMKHFLRLWGLVLLWAMLTPAAHAWTATAATGLQVSLANYKLHRHRRVKQSATV